MTELGFVIICYTSFPYFHRVPPGHWVNQADEL